MAAQWQDDLATPTCFKCNQEFGIFLHRHHCRKCGKLFCDKCTSNKMIVPRELLSARPTTFLQTHGLFSDMDTFRGPQRVCDECSYSLRPLQSDLRQEVSRCNLETTVDAESFDNQYLPNMPQLDFMMENQISNAVLMLHNAQKSGEKIPGAILDVAKGIAFLTILKVGFMVTGRYGTGIVLSKLPDGSWSAPSAIAMSGLGWGIQLGTEVSDVMLVLSTDSAVEAFKSTGQLTIGAELGVSLGPIGKSLETDVTVGNKGAAHAFSYAVSHGLFAGVSLEACGIVQRKDVNRKFYGERAHASALLAGEFARPLGAEPIYKSLDALTFEGDNEQQAENEVMRLAEYERLRTNFTGTRNRGISALAPGAPGTSSTEKDTSAVSPHSASSSQADPHSGSSGGASVEGIPNRRQEGVSMRPSQQGEDV
jgi:lipid-binding SYLF domain-containing protein